MYEFEDENILIITEFPIDLFDIETALTASSFAPQGGAKCREAHDAPLCRAGKMSSVIPMQSHGARECEERARSDPVEFAVRKSEACGCIGSLRLRSG